MCRQKMFITLAWQCGLVVPSLHATEETGAMGPEIEYHQGIGL
jgi:hypothetical protein